MPTCNFFFLKKFLQSKFIKYWGLELEKCDKLRTYREFKLTFMFEKYLKHVSNPSDRSNLARFRTSSHKLRIEYGRYTVPKTPITERLCTQCSLNAECSGRRVSLFNDMSQVCCSKSPDSNKDIASQTYMSKFNWLLSNEDPVICKDIACFTTECFALRS